MCDPEEQKRTAGGGSIITIINSCWEKRRAAVVECCSGGSHLLRHQAQTMHHPRPAASPPGLPEPLTGGQPRRAKASPVDPLSPSLSISTALSPYPSSCFYLSCLDPRGDVSRPADGPNTVFPWRSASPTKKPDEPSASPALSRSVSRRG